MIKLRVLEILDKQGHTRYWLHKQMGMTYQNLIKMVNGKTKSIKYDNLDALCQILNCEPHDLFCYNPNE